MTARVHLPASATLYPAALCGVRAGNRTAFKGVAHPYATCERCITISERGEKTRAKLNRWASEGQRLPCKANRDPKNPFHLIFIAGTEKNGLAVAVVDQIDPDGNHPDFQVVHVHSHNKLFDVASIAAGARAIGELLVTWGGWNEPDSDKMMAALQKDQDAVRRVMEIRKHYQDACER